MSRDAVALLVAKANADKKALATAISDACNASKIAADADAAALHAMYDELMAQRALMHPWETLCEAVLFYTGATNIPSDEVQGVWDATMAALEPVLEPPSTVAVDEALAAATKANCDESRLIEIANTTAEAAPGTHVNDHAMMAAVAAKFDGRQCMGPGEEVESLLSWAGSHPKGGPGADRRGFRGYNWKFLVESFNVIRQRQENRMTTYRRFAAEEGAPPSQA